MRNKLLLALLLPASVQAQALGCFVGLDNPDSCSTQHIECSTDSDLNRRLYGSPLGALCSRAEAHRVLSEMLTERVEALEQALDETPFCWEGDDEEQEPEIAASKVRRLTRKLRAAKRRYRRLSR